MLRIEVRADSSSFRTALAALGADAVRAEVRALNKTIEGVQTQAVRILSDDLSIQQKRVREALSLKRATFGDKVAVLQVSGRRIHLYAFAARQTAKGVTYRLGGKGRSFIRSAFIATMRSGHVGVFARHPTKKMRYQRPTWKVPRAAIIEQRGPSLPYVFAQQRIQEVLVQHAAGLLGKHLAHEISFLASSPGTRS